MLSLHVPRLDGAAPPSSRRVAPDGIRLADIKSRLRQLWDLLIDNLKHRVTTRQIYLCGVRLKPTKETAPRPIPSEWASTFRAQARAGTISSGDEQFGDIMVSDQPWEDQQAIETPRPTTAPLMPEDASPLSDDAILALLEEHAKRVVENDARMIDPRKTSLTPIIRRKMQYRADHDELLQTLAAEVRALHAWIECRLPSFQVPAPGTIENGIRDAYRQLNPRSKPMIKS